MLAQELFISLEKEPDSIFELWQIGVDASPGAVVSILVDVVALIRSPIFEEQAY